MPLSSIRLACCLLVASAAVASAQTRPSPASAPQTAFAGQTQPLLSMASLRFLEGTWSAVSRDGRTSLGSYTFARELNGTVLARHSVTDPACDPTRRPACGRRDLFYVFQDSPGAPLQAISFDSEGHVLHYLVTQTAEESTSTLGRRDFVRFDTDPAMLGPRIRLLYIHNVDTATGKDVLSGSFQMLQPNGTYRDLQQWSGIRE